MAEILAENLSDKNVVGTDGAEIGRLYNVTMEYASGSLHNLLVEPAERANADFETDDRGRYRIPVSRVQAVKDHIVVAR
ncbi:PRC-barrel domain-containing protein [Halosegnis sp.]|uniref:PRC-barrel domain-containing protein n=1 Tax=Halosegnis sp. TaxID=2864959 RepID=UPI0035D4F0E4